MARFALMADRILLVLWIAWAMVWGWTEIDEAGERQQRWQEVDAFAQETTARLNRLEGDGCEK